MLLSRRLDGGASWVTARVLEKSKQPVSMFPLRANELQNVPPAFNAQSRQRREKLARAKRLPVLKFVRQVPLAGIVAVTSVAFTAHPAGYG